MQRDREVKNRLSIDGVIDRHYQAIVRCWGDVNGIHAVLVGAMHEAVDAALASAPAAEPVGTLTVQRFRGHLENASFDYSGSLADGTYPLYTRPATQDSHPQAQRAETARLDWLLPNLHPANFGLDYDTEKLDDDHNAEFRRAIDLEIKSREGAQQGHTNG